MARIGAEIGLGGVSRAEQVLRIGAAGWSRCAVAEQPGRAAEGRSGASSACLEKVLGRLARRGGECMVFAPGWWHGGIRAVVFALLLSGRRGRI